MRPVVVVVGARLVVRVKVQASGDRRLNHRRWRELRGCSCPRGSGLRPVDGEGEWERPEEGHDGEHAEEILCHVDGR